MPNILTVGVAQLGPIARRDTRASVVVRLLELMRQAHASGCKVVTFPEMALTTFFPRWMMEDEAEVDSYFETSMPSPDTAPLFEEAGRLGIGFYLGYCELAYEGGQKRRYNSSVLVDQRGTIVGKYRKVHVLGNRVVDPSLPYQHLEPYYFTQGNLGFPAFDAFGVRVGMAICNDRRWPETYRSVAMKGADLLLLGFNTPAQLPDWPDQNELRLLHHLLPMQSAAYQNGLWVCAAGKAGNEENEMLMGHSVIVAPTGEVVATTLSLGDELITYRCNMDLSPYYKSFFDFARNRRPDQYQIG